MSLSKLSVRDVFGDSSSEEECGSEGDFSEDDSVEEESDEEIEEDDIPLSAFRIGAWYQSRDGHIKWMKNKDHNVVTAANGLKGDALHAESEVDFFCALLTPDIFEILIKNTNIKIEEENASRVPPKLIRLVDMVEMKAFLGCLLLLGSYQAGRCSLDEIWNNSVSGINMLCAIMSLSRFRVILRFLRFDDKTDRVERLKTDKLAAVRDIIEAFNVNFKANYVPSECLTVDEMLPRFRGNCSFRQYIPSKPSKYGIKCQALCDALTFYTMTVEVYCGQQPDGPYQISNKPLDVLIRLLGPFSGSGRNVSADNWYCSLQAAQRLRDMKLTLVGTVRKNKKELPIVFTDPKNREIQSTLAGYHDGISLLSYVPKKGRTVVLISSMHNEVIIDPSSSTKKPEVINFYNTTKGGVDVVDQRVSLYSTARRSRRWTLTTFFHFLDVTTTNAYVSFLHKQTTRPARQKFMKIVALSLAKDYLLRRISMKNLHEDLKITMKKVAEVGGIEIPTEEADEDYADEEQPPKKKAGRCQLCPRHKDKKAYAQCSMCSKFVCPAHKTKITSCTACKA